MKVNLTIPTSWRNCTPAQLEAICLAKQQVQNLPPEQQTLAWKTNCFLALTNLEVEEADLIDDEGNKYFLVLQTSALSPSSSALSPSPLALSPQPSALSPQTSFPLYLWQIHSFIKDHLQWLDAIPDIPRFPYPEWESGGVTFRGPSIQLSNWTWQQYRLFKDYLELFFKVSAQAVQSVNVLRSPNPHSHHSSLSLQMLLATLYDRQINYIDEITQLPKYDYHYHPDQSTSNKDFFKDFPPIRVSVILLWWASTAHKLQKDYPKCFASSDKPDKKKKPPKQQDPIADYARTTATLEKYMGVNEQQLQQESFRVVLQHLNDMIKHNEEIERMNAKMKSKH